MIFVLKIEYFLAKIFNYFCDDKNLISEEKQCGKFRFRKPHLFFE